MKSVPKRRMSAWEKCDVRNDPLIGKSFSFITDVVQLNNKNGEIIFYIVIFLQKYLINEKKCSIILHIQWRNM